MRDNNEFSNSDFEKKEKNIDSIGLFFLIMHMAIMLAILGTLIWFVFISDKQPQENALDNTETVAETETQTETFEEETDTETSTEEDVFLRINDSGEDVLQLQNALKTLGYSTVNTSGTFDETTEAVVIAYQVSNKITPANGEVTEEIYEKILSEAEQKSAENQSQNGTGNTPIRTQPTTTSAPETTDETTAARN